MKDINEILNTNYEDFIRPFPIYLTWRSARKKGYEAHHIIPRTVQEKEKGKVYDDRCIRVTCFEHILAHYLYCRDYPEESSQFLAFNLMCYENAKELLEDEKKFLEELPYFAEMREKGLHQISEANKGENNPNYGKQRSEETRKKISEGNKGNNPSAKKVFQRDLDGNIIQVFSTVKEAGIQLGKSVFTIRNYIHGKTPNNLPYTLSYN